MSIIQCLEKPYGQYLEYGVIQIEGWAFSTAGSIKKVEIRCGRKTVLATIGIERSDVGKAHPAFEEHSSISGYCAEVKLSPKQSSKKQRLRIKIIAETEVLEIEKVLYPQDVSEKKFFGFSLAIQKTMEYIRTKKLPRNFSELKRCVQKFWKIFFSKSIQYNSIADQIKKNPYLYWLQKHSVTESQRECMLEKIKQFSYQPLISIIMPAYKSNSMLLEKAICSVKDQIYQNWELIINDDGTPDGSLEKIVLQAASEDPRIRFHRMEHNSNISVATNVAVDLAQGEFLFFMDHDDTIECHALFKVAEVLNSNDEIDIIYSDDDKISMSDKRYDPQFKPDFSPELLLSFMYFSHIFVIRKALFQKIGGCRIGFEGVQDFDLALRAVEITDKIIHIPEILYHWRATPTSTAFNAETKPESLLRGKRAVEDAVKRRNLPAQVAQPKFAEDANIGIYTLRYDNKEFPLISIIIPTKNHTEVLKRCINSIRAKTTYPNYEIILVDNCSDKNDTLEYYKSLPYDIITCEDSEGKFNFSKMVNTGASRCKGEYIVLLNNDTEIISETWLEDLLVYARIPGIGIVGCKLLYPDRSVQHAGVVLRMFNGVAGHAFKLLPDWDGGYLSFANCARNYSAVTAACFMTTRVLYQQIGGFDEENFGVSFNDVDFCLRVRKAGLRIVYNPNACLYHHEGKSRGVEQTGYYSDSKEEYNFLRKWNIDCWFNDPYYNPNLSLTNERFEVDCIRSVPNSNIPLKILLVTHNLNYEGAPLMQLHIALGLQRKYSFMVLSPLDGPLKDIYESAGISVVIKEMEQDSKVDLVKYNAYLADLIKYLEKEKIDLVYSNTIETFWGIDLAARLDAPAIWGIHESIDVKRYFADNYPQEISQVAINQFSYASKVAFVAETTKQMYHCVDAMNLVVIKNGIDLKRIQEYRRTHEKSTLRNLAGIKEDEILVSIFGTVCFRKGQRVFIEAARDLSKDKNRKLLFYIVGAKQSTYLNDLKRYIEENGLEEKVKIIEVCDDIYQYYMMSDYFVCASYEESSPQVVLEAMAFELPIVSTNVFGIPEQIRNECEALLVEPGNPIAIADALRRLMDDANLSDKLTQNGIYRLKSKFTYEMMLKNYDYLFQEAFQEGSRTELVKYWSVKK